MSDKTTKEVTFAEHIAAIRAAVPANSSLNIEVRIFWSKKLQDYVIGGDVYGGGTLVRLTLRPERKK